MIIHRPPITLPEHVDAAWRFGMFALTTVALAACVAVEWWNTRPCKRCRARLVPDLVREHGCAFCEERAS